MVDDNLTSKGEEILYIMKIVFIIFGPGFFLEKFLICSFLRRTLIVANLGIWNKNSDNLPHSEFAIICNAGISFLLLTSQHKYNEILRDSVNESILPPTHSNFVT